MKKKRDCTNGHITDFFYLFVDQILLRDFSSIFETPLRSCRKRDVRRHVKLLLFCGEAIPCLSRLKVGPMKTSPPGRKLEGQWKLPLRATGVFLTFIPRQPELLWMKPPLKSLGGEGLLTHFCSLESIFLTRSHPACSLGGVLCLRNRNSGGQLSCW